MQIAIASGKGGTGKTTLAVNLSIYLSDKFNDSGKKIVLTDLDVEEPNSGLFLNGDLLYEEEQHRMVPDWNADTCTLCQRCANLCEFNALAFLGISVIVFPELCHSCYACSDLCPDDALPMVPHRMGELKWFKIEKQLHFIESRLDIGVEQATPLIKQTKKFVKTNFDASWITIIDAPPGTSCPVIEAVKGTDLVILVTEPTPFGLHDLKLAVETMEELQKKTMVVINKYGIGNHEVENYCAEKNIPVIGKIPHLRQAAEYYSKGKVLIHDLPEIRKEMEKISNEIEKWIEIQQ